MQCSQLYLMLCSIHMIFSVNGFLLFVFPCPQLTHSAAFFWRLEWCYLGIDVCWRFWSFCVFGLFPCNIMLTFKHLTLYMDMKSLLLLSMYNFDFLLSSNCLQKIPNEMTMILMSHFFQTTKTPGCADFLRWKGLVWALPKSICLVPARLDRQITMGEPVDYVIPTFLI